MVAKNWHCVCFTCGGAGVVEYKPRKAAPAPARAGKVPGKVVELKGFGACRIRRAKGGFVVNVPGEYGTLTAWFHISRGRVAMNRSVVVNGLAGRMDALERALQGAYRA